MRTPTSLSRGPGRAALAVLALLAGCASSDRLVGLSIATTGSTSPRVGEAVGLVVRAIYDDGSSAEITARAACRVEGDAAVGVVRGATFTAAAPGTVAIVCAYEAASASLALTVAGFRAVPIAAIQRGEVAVATPVEVEGIVFAVAPDAGFTDFWMQDPGGGAYSGIYARDGRAAGSPAVEEGQRVRVTGVTNERNGRSVLEVDAVATVGSATPTVDTVALADLDAARWDGCLVAVTDVVVSNPAVDAYTWEVTAAAAPAGPRLLIDTLLFDSQPAAGQAFTRITGPIFPFVSGAGVAGFALEPRRAADLEGGAGGATTPYDLHAGAVAAGSAVTLAGLVVTAIDYVDPTSGQVDLYAQAPAGGAGAGVFLRDTRAAPTAPAVGDLVTITGVYDVVRGRAQIDYDALAVTGHAPATATPIDVASDDLTAFESVLVVATTLRVSRVAVDAYSYEVTDDRAGGAATARVDLSLYDPLPRVGDRYDALTGVVFRGQAYTSIAPRSRDDVELW